MTMRIRVRRSFYCVFENGIVSWWQGIAIIAIGPAIKGWIEGANKDAFPYTSAMPVGVFI